MGIVYSGRRESPDAVIVLREGAVTRLRHLGGPSSRSMAAGSSTGPGFSIQMPSVPLPPPPGVQEPSVTASNEQSSGGVREVSGDDQKAGALLSSLTVVNDDDFEAERGVRRLERPRFELEPKHALLCIMVLVCALATTLTLLVQQAANMGALDTQATTNASSHTTATASPSDRDSTPSTAAPEPSPSASDNKQDTLVNINTADEAQLQEIKAIGPVTAARIIEYRTQHGAFASLDDLVNVPGIGMKTVEKLRPWACAQ